MGATRVGCGPPGCCGSHKDKLQNTMCYDGYGGRLRVTLRAMKYVVVATRIGCGPPGCCGSHKDRLRNTMCYDGYGGRLRVTLRAMTCR